MMASRTSQAPKIELVPNDPDVFKDELLRTRRARRIWFYQDGHTYDDVWRADKLQQSSPLFVNIRTNSIYRKWRSLGITKVHIEIVEEEEL